MLTPKGTISRQKINILRGSLERFNDRNGIRAHEIIPGKGPIELKLWKLATDNRDRTGTLPGWFRSFKTLTRRITGGDIILPLPDPDPGYQVYIKDWRTNLNTIHDARLEGYLNTL